MFAQTQEAIKSDRLITNKYLSDDRLLENYTPLENFLIPGDAGQLISAATYAFSSQSGLALEDMSGGTTQIIAAGQDDTASAITNIGFDFWYDGVRFTQFSCNANGVCRLGGTGVTTDFNNTSATAGFPTTTNAPKIAPFFEDLCTGTNGRVHYKVIGGAPNRKLVVEFQNMQITRGTGCAGAGGGTFQLWLTESGAASAPGKIQFVYGNGIVASATADGGASIGLQSGSATNFASVTASNDSVSYATHDGSNAAGIAAGKSYAFTPNVPNAPSGLAFSPVTQTSVQLNWTDNATGEIGYAIYRSTDGANFTFLTQTAADAVSFNDQNLVPGTTYSYRVQAVSEGALSGAVSGSQATGPAGNIACNGPGGPWGSTSTWVGGVVPGAGDNVTIGTGCAVSVNTDAAALSLTIGSGAGLEFESGTARTLTVTTNLTNNGTIQSSPGGTVTTHVLSVGGDFVNNGTLDLSTNGNTAGAELRFTGAANNSFAGTGSADLRILTIQKGTGAVSATSPTLDINLSNLSVRGAASGGTSGFLNTAAFNGIVKFSGTNAFSDTVFQSAAYSIPSTGGVWLNNPNFTVAGQNGSPILSGLLRITQGTFNIGTSTGNSMGFATGSTVIVEGGAVNAAGRFGVSAAGNAISYTQSGGTVTVQTAGNASTTLGGFDLGTSVASNISISGGTIVVQLAGTGATQIDYRNQAGTGITGVTGGTLQLGNANSGAAKSFVIRGVVPNLELNNASAGHSASWSTTLANYNNISRNITINPGTTLNLGNVVFLFYGTTLTNNGTLTHNGASSNTVIFTDYAPVTYTGSGTVTVPLSNFAVQSTQGFTIDASSPGFATNAVRLFAGNITNAGKITIGNGGATSAIIQIGNTTTPTAAGTFDSTPNFNAGTGGIIFSILRTESSRATGPEIPASRTITNLTYDDNAPGRTLTVAGGNLTVTGALALTNGVIVTSDSNVLKHNGAATRTNGYVDGPLARDYTAIGAYTYHVGDNGYSPLAANVTAGTGSLTAAAIDAVQPNMPNPAKAISRYWKLAGSGITSDLTFNYLDEDVPVTATEANLAIAKYDGAVTFPGGTVNAAANTATITGVTSFSDWTLAENTPVVSPGTLQLSGATYSANESAGTVSITVNRTGGTDGAVTIDYALGGGSAIGGAACGAGVDYVNTGGTVSFANGETSKSFNVVVCGDTEVESNETFNVTLSNATGGATLGTPASATVTITDDDVVGGAVTVTASAGTTAGTYATLTEAVAAVNAGTHQGAVVININQSTTEPGSVVVNGSGAGAASYTSLLIRPTADGLTVSGASTVGRGLIELNGADNVTIDGDNPNSGGTNRNLTLRNTAANTVNFTSVIRIALNTTDVTSANDNAFRNLNIVGSAAGRNTDTATSTTGPENTTFGIFSGPGAAGATAVPGQVSSVSTGVAAGATVTNLIVDNNNVTVAARAISINGAATTVHTGLQVNNNSIGNPAAGDADQVTSIGITVNGAVNPVIAGNTVYVEGFVRSSAATHGINVGVNSTNTTGAVIERNRVNRVRNNDLQSWSAYGINVAGIAASAHTVRNNFVSGVINSQTGGTGAFGTTFGAYGIRVASGTGHLIYHNSVNLYGVMPGVANTNVTAAFLIVGTGQTGLDVRNNIFSNQITGGNPNGTRNVAIMLPSGGTSAMNLTLNNNIYFVGTDPNNRLAQVGATFGAGEFQAADFDPSTTTPATNFRAYSSTLNAAGTNDNASLKVNPQFVSDTDLHIQPTSLAETRGVNVGVTNDIDGQTRPAAPDIGADEITVAGPGTVQFGTVGFSGEEGTTATINVIRSAGTDGTVGVTATVTDGTATGGASCAAGVDYINPGPQTLTFGNGVSLQSFTIQLCADTTLEPGETVILTLSNPTGGTTIGANNPATLTIGDDPPPLSGTLNVGAGEIFTSLTNAGGLFAALNRTELTGDLTINITSDLTAETGAVALNQLTETGAGGYTLTIKPSGAPRTISGLSPASTGLIILNGADRVVIDGSLSGGTDRSLTITNTQTGTSTVIWIRSASAANGANDNTIKNTIINGAGSTTVQTTAGILAGSGATIGGPAEAPNNGNTITNNHIYRVQNSIYNQGNTGFDQNWTITNNEFGSTTEADKNRFRGMLMGNANNFVISGNTVLGVTNFDGTTGANSGIHLAFSVTNGTVTNNRISNVHNLSTGGSGAFGLQLSAGPSAAQPTAVTTNILIANNFIWDIQAVGSTTVAFNGHGITVNGAATAGGYKIYHNSVNLNTNQSSGTTAALNVTNAVVAAGAIDLRNNILANPQTSGATPFAVFSAAPANVFSTIDFNDYFAQNVGSLGGTVRPTLTDWQAATGQDANSKAVDPLFVSPTDLHIQPASPLVGAGAGGTGVTTDIDGQTRDTPPEIGADELPAASTPGIIQFSADDYSVNEAGGTVTLTVTRTGGSAGAVSVNYATANGTATGGASCGAGVDFVNASGTLNWAADDTAAKTFNVTICNDSVYELAETFTATLSGVTGGATIGANNPATVTIESKDPAPPGTITVSDVRVAEGNTGGAVATFTVTYTGVNPASASVQYATANGTATANLDYLPTSGTLTFDTGTTRTVSVAIVGKTLKEANETFYLNLSNPVNAVLADSQGVGIIVDEDRTYTSDFDRDWYSDLGIFRPGEIGGWYIVQSSSSEPNILAFGTNADRPVPGDYDGDGKTDVAVYRASEGVWYIINSSDASVQITTWGGAGDKPVQGDYDGDGKTDIAIYRPSTGEWWITRSAGGGAFTVTFGVSTDRPVQGDYDGDFKTDVAVYRDGTWYMLLSSNGSVAIQNFGLPTDKPVSGDFDGDGRYDVAIFRDGQFWTLNSLTGTASVVTWGTAGDIPVPADYDRDGTTDYAIFRPSTGEWYVLRSSNLSYFSLVWGQNGDFPIAAGYLPQ
ncbi:MAG TPA: Calx-beta domain-containing protein [Pyrinomonadaceae bacterium]